MRKYVQLSILLLICGNSYSQIPERSPDGGSSYDFRRDVKDEMSPATKAAIVAVLQENETLLRSQGKLSALRETNAVAFGWPLRQKAGFTENGYYGISNYVDGNSGYPNQLLDYNCGNRTYDLSSGYNHAGTDIFTWPFPWQKMAQNAVEIIAAAPGTIIAKSNGNSDQNCSFCVSACNWNAVYIMHADGSVAWYGHMKNNSLTPKAVGQTVSLGEYLGVVGSSGNSTGPHLHFEVYTNSSYTTLVDPWGGSCNAFNGLTSWWANQEPYYVSTLNKVMTHSAPPAMPGCAAGEVLNSKVNFLNGQPLYLGGYYRDQQAGQTALHTIYRPDNSVYTSWTQTFNVFYSASYWYYSLTLPNPAPTGIWRYSISYNAQTVTANFGVNAILPLRTLEFNAAKKATNIQLNFNTTEEENLVGFNILKSTDGNSFTLLSHIPARNGLYNTYAYIDNNPAKNNYYKIEIVDLDGSKKYSETRQVSFNVNEDYMIIAGNPFRNNLQIKMLQPVPEARIEVINAAGQMVLSLKYAMLEGNHIIPFDRFTNGLYQVILKSKSEILGRKTVIKQ